MALVDRMPDDTLRILTNLEQFATSHSWDGDEIICVVDNDTALKRKNNNVVDVSYDLASAEMLLFVDERQFVGKKKPVPMQTVTFDDNLFYINRVDTDSGVLEIAMISKKGRDVI